MEKIDIEKFICSIIEAYPNFKREGTVPYMYKQALQDQGLEYNDGQIVEIPKPLKIKAGHWYMCIKDYGFCGLNYLPFEKGKVYKSEKDDELTESDGEKWPFGDAKDYFRPATEDEIPHEPKFKAGDYVVSNLNPAIKYHITGTIINELGEYDYVCKDISGGEFDGKFRPITASKLEGWARLWDVSEDAKDGDVLVDSRANPFIFSGKLDEDDYPIAYCGINLVGNFIQARKKGWADFVGVTPATQEQQDLLFQKMKEAGYEWDAETKTLKKLLSPADVGFEELGKIWEEEGVKKIQKPDLDNTNGTNTIKFEEPEEELTEFEKQFEAYMYHPDTNPVIMHACCQKLLFLAHKQIAEEIDVNCLVNSFAKEKTSNEMMIFEVYRKGILDTLEKIKQCK